MKILITGASGFIGGSVAERLAGRDEIRGLTSHPAKNRFAGRVRNYLYDFEHPERMAEAFQGVDVFLSTYYIRFNYKGLTFDDAVARSRMLFDLARAAGVRRLVHVSVTNADERSPLPYYRNKGVIERLVRESGIEHAIVRPALVVGRGDILVNNIAYFLRRTPIFAVVGRGGYRVQPITIEAFADILVEAIDGSFTGETRAVAGPRDWRFVDLVHAVREAVAGRAVVTHAPAPLVLAALGVAGLFLGDVVLTDDEIEGLIGEYLVEENPIRRGIDVADWLRQPGVSEWLGRHYESELARHFQTAGP